MSTSADYIRELKTRHKITSDGAAARLIGVTRQAISRINNGEDSFSDSTAIKVAELIDRDPEELMLAAHAERAKDDRAKALWLHLLKKAGYAAGVAVVAAGVSGAPSPAQASTGPNPATICIMSTSDRRRRGYRPPPHSATSTTKKPGSPGFFSPYPF